MGWHHSCREHSARLTHRLNHVCVSNQPIVLMADYNFDTDNPIGGEDPASAKQRNMAGDFLPIFG